MNLNILSDDCKRIIEAIRLAVCVATLCFVIGLSPRIIWWYGECMKPHVPKPHKNTLLHAPWDTQSPYDWNYYDCKVVQNGSLRTYFVTVWRSAWVGEGVK